MARRASIIPSETLGRIINTPLEEHRKALSKYSWLPDVLRIEGSIIPHVLGPVLTVTIFAAFVATAELHLGWELRLSNNVLPLLSVVVGLILVFRNSTSYDRFYEGRKDFASMTSQTRNLARLIWINVSTPPVLSSSPSTPTTPTKPSPKLTKKITKLKLRAMRLLIAFPLSVMHHLRRQNGSESHASSEVLMEQLRAQVGIVDFRDSKGRGRNYGTVEEEGEEVRKRASSASSKSGAAREEVPSHTTPLLVDVEAQVTADIEIREHPHITNAPLLIAHELTRMIWKFKRAGMLDTVGPAGTNAMMGLIQSMVDMLTAMERVSNTPIPASYGIHLKQCVTLYLFALPLTLVNDMGYNMIPIVTVVAFTLMGIEGIANQIEMPFGNDMSDLPLEKYCDEIRRDIEYIIQYLPQGDEEDAYMRDMPQDDEDDALTF